MADEKTQKKRVARQQYLFEGHRIQLGQIVKTSGDATGYFRVVRVWGHHVTLEPLTVTEVSNHDLATSITVQRERKR